MGFHLALVRVPPITLDAFEPSEIVMAALTNFHLQGMTACDAALRQLGTGASFMTPNVMEGDCEQCLSVGMDDCVSKPVKRQEFHRVLAR